MSKRSAIIACRQSASTSGMSFRNNVEIPQPYTGAFPALFSEYSGYVSNQTSNGRSLMRTISLLIFACFLFAITVPSGYAQTGNAAGTDQWEKTILEFEQKDREQFPPEGAILFVGSSSFRMWKTLEKDMAPLLVINRGFGGSQTADALRYADRIVIPYKPSMVVVYEGDNDIAAKKTPETIAGDYKRFVEKIRGAFPDIPIFFVSIKPSPSRWTLWSNTQRANELIGKFTQSQTGLEFIDVATPMLNDKGVVRPELFLDDALHLNESGYRLWTSIIKPRLAEYVQKSSSGTVPFVLKEPSTMIIDLSHPVYAGMPIYPGDPVFSVTRVLSHEKDGCCVHDVSFGTHTGTHIDAPFHFLADGATVDTEAVLKNCAGEALVIDVSGTLDDNEIKPSNLGKALADIHEGDRVLLRTGWDSHYGKSDFFSSYPGISEELTDLLVERKIALIGVEMPSIHTKKGVVIHKKLLSAGIIIVEELTNLDALDEGRVFFSAVPLRLKGLDGCPVRAYAIVPDR
ncbi:cyclase family protein [bacterium]|nr:cyclase family protein [bacterium]